MDSVEQHLIDNIVTALGKRTAADEQARLALQDFNDTLHTAFKYGMTPDQILSYLEDAIDYFIGNEIVEQYKPKNRKSWKLLKLAQAPLKPS